MITQGQKVKATKMTSDSVYAQVIGTVSKVKNGFADIETEQVMSKWSDEFKSHRMNTSTRVENLELV